MEVEIIRQNEIIEENAAYVLGMVDLYQNDDEIIQMLRMKGLGEDIVQKVMQQVKKPTYVKRIKQGKRLVLLALLILVVLVVIPFAAIVMSGGSPKVLINPNSIPYDAEREGMLFVYFKWILRIAGYVTIVVIVQLVTGIHTYIKYSRLLRGVA